MKLARMTFMILILCNLIMAQINRDFREAKKKKHNFNLSRIILRLCCLCEIGVTMDKFPTENFG